MTDVVELGGRLDARGGHNRGLYLLAKDYKGHSADTLILKVLKTEPDDRDDTWHYGEVKALSHIREYVDSGTMLIPARNAPPSTA